MSSEYFNDYEGNDVESEYVKARTRGLSDASYKVHLGILHLSSSPPPFLSIFAQSCCDFTLMPKKRSTNLYTKPQSTAHPSLRSPATASSSGTTDSDAPPSVNDLISSLRKSTVSAIVPTAASPAPSHTLPPQIRNLLSQPETLPPAPRARDRRRYDAYGRRLPAGPAPPRSWLESSRYGLGLRKRLPERLFPADLSHLPGLQAKDVGKGMRLQDICLRNMAHNWEFIKEYERYNLADLPTRLRVLLLSNIALHGPDEGVGYEALRNLSITPSFDNSETLTDRITNVDPGGGNDNFHRLDLSGSVGRSISFKQLIELLQKPTTPNEDDSTSDFTWEESLSHSLSAPIPHLTHLSISHPPHTVSWPRLLALTKHLPNLTHLSLAYWPVPSLTPNATTTVVASRYTRDVQYGGTNLYSHSLDNDFREAADILRKLAAKLYGLEYLDLSGCIDWLRALRWTGDDANDKGLEWGSQWVRMKTLRIYSGINLAEASEYSDVVRFIQGYKEALVTEKMLAWWVGKNAGSRRRKQWIEVEKDEYERFRALWGGDGEEEKRKREALNSLQRKGFAESAEWRVPIVYDVEEERVAARATAADTWG
ncbi:hypothetical protein BGZ60DRAFT_435852 [Tricladium varicosporioides]|nr:hypothetical protein BGZ60DRAFT_435852 [Hymenoscyphus varicosporioides]